MLIQLHIDSTNYQLSTYEHCDAPPDIYEVDCHNRRLRLVQLVSDEYDCVYSAAIVAGARIRLEQPGQQYVGLGWNNDDPANWAAHMEYYLRRKSARLPSWLPK